MKISHIASIMFGLDQIINYLPWIIIAILALGVGYCVLNTMKLKEESAQLKKNYQVVQDQIRYGIIVDNNPHQIDYQKHDDESTESDEAYYQTRYSVHIDDPHQVMDNSGMSRITELEGDRENASSDDKEDLSSDDRINENSSPVDNDGSSLPKQDEIVADSPELPRLRLNIKSKEGLDCSDIISIDGASVISASVPKKPLIALRKKI